MFDADLMRHTDSLFRYAMVLVRNTPDAEDLVQETYSRALKASGSLRPDSDGRRWLFAILRNIWLNQLRSRRTALNFIELEVDDTSAAQPRANGENTHEVDVTEVERQLVRDAIQRLPLVFREIIILREYEDSSYEEIGGLLECPPGTVMSRLARARTKLQSLLSKAWRPYRASKNKRQIAPFMPLAVPQEPD